MEETTRLGCRRRADGDEGVASTGPVCALPDEIKERARRRIVAETAWRDGCQVWTGRMASTGYGLFHLMFGRQKRVSSPHRVNWILTHGPINDPALVIDHLCRNRACCNPDHLELVESRVNSLRGAGSSISRPGLGLPEVIHRPSMHKEFCHRGHLMDEENTRLRLKRGKHHERACRTCARENARTNFPSADGMSVGDPVAAEHNPFAVAPGQKWETPDHRILVVTFVQWDIVRKRLMPAAGTQSKRSNRAGLESFKDYKRMG